MELARRAGKACILLSNESIHKDSLSTCFPKTGVKSTICEVCVEDYMWLSKPKPFVI